MKEACEEYLGKSVYASAMILGAAFQKGFLPFELTEMEEAFKTTMKKAELLNNLSAFHLGRALAIQTKLPIKENRNSDKLNLLKQSIKESVVFNHQKLAKLHDSSVQKLQYMFPSIETFHLAQYIHDLIIFDRGIRLDHFLADALIINNLYRTDLQEMALRTLAKTYFIKDEVFIAHAMISPMRRQFDEKNYKNLGSGFKKTFINRPSFDIGSKKIEFDFSPRPWMLKIMRQARFLRTLLPAWHKLEREIGINIKEKILANPLNYSELKRLENIKGYRDVRYLLAEEK